MHPSFGVAKTYLATVPAPVATRRRPAAARRGRRSTTGRSRSTASASCRASGAPGDRRGRPARGPQAHRPAAARRGRASGAAAGAHRDRAGAPRRPAGRAPLRPLTRAELAGLHRLVDISALRRRRRGAAWRCGRSAERSRSTRNDRDADPRGRVRAGHRGAAPQRASTTDDLISIVFTATPDLTAEFPAYAARLMGMTDVPLLCTTEIAVPGAMPRVLRLLAHVETDAAAGRDPPRLPARGGRAAHATCRSSLPRGTGAGQRAPSSLGPP